MTPKQMHNVSSDSLIALEKLIHRVGGKWKYHMRELKSVPLSENSFAVFSLKLKEMDASDIHDLSLLSLKFVEKTTRPMIFQELKKRRQEGLRK